MLDDLHPLSKPSLCPASPLLSFIDMSSSEDESHSVSHIFGLHGFEEPSLDEVGSFNHEEVESPFMVACQLVHRPV